MNQIASELTSTNRERNTFSDTENSTLSRPKIGANSFLIKVASVAAVIMLLGQEAAQSATLDTKWDRDNRSRREQRESSVAQFRNIQAPAEILKKGDAYFGKAIQIIEPSEQMAKTYNLPSDYKANVYAWVGAPAASIRKSGQLHGAIILMDLNSGKDFATIYSPKQEEGHGFGWGLKLSPDGKFLGIESATSCAAILNQETGEVALLEHSNFGNYFLSRKDGKYYPDVDKKGGDYSVGCRLEFLPDNKVIVSGAYAEYIKRNGKNLGEQTKFEIFNTSGLHLQSLAEPGLKISSTYRYYTSSCFGSTGPNMHFSEKTNSLYYITNGMFDSEVRRSKIQGIALGKVGILDLNNDFLEIDTTLFPNAANPDFVKPPIGARLADIFTFAGNKLLISKDPLFESYDSENAGEVLIYSIESKNTVPEGTISIGKTLGKQVAITSMLTLNNNQIIVSYTDLEKNSYLALCSIDTLEFKEFEGFKVANTSHGITEIKINPHDKKRILLGIPSYQDIQGTIMEINLQDDFFYHNLYENFANQ